MIAPDPIQRARSLTPMLEQSARSTDSNGVPAEHIAALRDANLLAPANVETVAEIGRALAHGCGATAWLATTFAQTAAMVARLSPAMKTDIGADLVAPAAIADTARLATKGNHYILSGAWPSVGGLAHAQWILLLGIDGDGKRLAALVRPDEVAITEIVYFGGLRGAAWRRIDVQNAVLPAHRVIAESELALGDDAPLLGALFGTAEGAYTDYVRATRARISGVGGKAVAQFTQVQARLAETHADLKGLEALYRSVLAKEASAEERARDRAYIARKSVDAINRLLSQMGAMGLGETNPVQRRFRDLRALASAPGLNWNAQLAAFGRRELGIDVAASDAA